MTYYWVGDKPVSALVLTPTKQGEEIDLELFDSVAGVYVKPSGMTTLADASIADGALQVSFPVGLFDEAGLYQLRLTLKATAGGQERLDAIQLVVHADDGWHTLPSARSEWQDAPARDERLWPLLEIAKQQVLAYAPNLTNDQLPPMSYRHAQLLQARNLFNAGRVDPSGSAGEDSFALTPFPLDWTVRQLLRPRTADPVAT